MAAAIWGTTPGPGGPVTDWDANAALLDSAYNGALWTNGLLTFTRIDGTNDAVTVGYVPDMVITGLLLSLQAAPSALDVDYIGGTVQINGVSVVVGVGGTVTVNAGDPINPRIDLIYVNNLGTVDKVTGTAAASPVPPATPANSLALAYVYVDANATAGTGGTTIQNLSFLKNNVFQGTANYQTVYFSADQDAYVPNNALQSDGATVGINIAPGTEALTIDGRVELADVVAPGTTTNKLYAVLGNLFWDGVQLNTGTTIAAGTTAGSILTWDGAAWTEDATVLVGAASVELDAKFIGTDNIATPAAPTSGTRLFSLGNNLYVRTPTGTIGLTNNGVLPAGSIGQTIAYQSGAWAASSRILNNGADLLGFNVTSGGNGINYNQSIGSLLINESITNGTDTITRQVTPLATTLTKTGGTVTGAFSTDWATGGFTHDILISGGFDYQRAINPAGTVETELWSDGGTTAAIKTVNVGAAPIWSMVINNGTATASLSMDLATNAELSFNDGANTSSVNCDGTNVNINGTLAINDGVQVDSAGGYAGTAVLVGGTATVANANVTANSVILVTSQADGGTPGFLRISARNAGVNFTITSSNAGDTSTVGWLMFELI